jgi:hypothetical protein
MNLQICVACTRYLQQVSTLFNLHLNFTAYYSNRINHFSIYWASFFNKCFPASCQLLNAIIIQSFGACGSVVGWGTMLQAGRSHVWVKMSWVLSIYLILPATLWPGVDSISNRNEYQESSWEERAASTYGWQPHHHLWADRLENVGASMSHNSMAFIACYRDSYILFFTFNRKSLVGHIATDTAKSLCLWEPSTRAITRQQIHSPYPWKANKSE